MGEVVLFEPTNDNLLYNILGSLADDIENGHLVKVKRYLEQLPTQLKIQILLTLTDYYDDSDITTE